MKRGLECLAVPAPGYQTLPWSYDQILWDGHSVL